jgi:hypothetical protein
VYGPFIAGMHHLYWPIFLESLQFQKINGIP